MKVRLMVTLGLLTVLLTTLVVIRTIPEKGIEENKPQEKQEEIIEEKIPEVVKPTEKEPVEIPDVEPEIELIPQEQTRAELVEKYGEDVINAWEKLTVDPNFNFVGKRITVKELYGPEGEVNYECYITTENGNEEWAGVGGNYYVYGTFISNEAIFDLVEYHNMFSAEI